MEKYIETYYTKLTFYPLKSFSKDKVFSEIGAKKSSELYIWTHPLQLEACSEKSKKKSQPLHALYIFTTLHSDDSVEGEKNWKSVKPFGNGENTGKIGSENCQVWKWWFLVLRNFQIFKIFLCQRVGKFFFSSSLLWSVFLNFPS